MNKFNKKSNKIIKKKYELMDEARTRGKLCKLKSSGKEWAHLTKFEVLGIVDFWQFCKKVQLQQCITSSIFNF